MKEINIDKKNRMKPTTYLVLGANLPTLAYISSACNTCMQPLSQYNSHKLRKLWQVYSVLLCIHLPCRCAFHLSCSPAKSSLPAFLCQPVCLSKMGWPGLSIGRSYSIGWLDPRFLSKILRPREDLLAGLHGHFHVVKGTCDTSALLLCLTRLHQVSHDEYTSSVCT